MINNIIPTVDELNKEQKTAVLNDINTFTKIVAGAGTGKTKIISKRYIKLIRDLEEKGIDNPIERLLVITFTEKAAAEMKERIFKELRENKINFSGQENKISTIHSFCSGILKKHAFEIGLSPNFKLADDKKLEEIKENITQKIILGELDSIENIQQVFDDLDLDISLFETKNLIKLKNFKGTDEILENIFIVIKEIKSLGLTPKQFLEQSLTAVENYSKTVASLPFNLVLREDYYSKWEEILKPYADASCTFNEKVIKELFGNGILISKNNSKKRTAEDWTPPKDFPENIKPITEIEKYLTKLTAVIYGIYQLELQANDLIDFDDLINKTLNLFDANEAIRAYYKKHFKHIIVDEFQDTSTAQMKLILRLVSDEAPNLTVVGDRKQSIYGFRYAKMENLDIIQKVLEDKFKTKFPEIKLITNYRSNPQVLDVVNFVTENELLLDEKLFENPNKKFEQNIEAVKSTTFEVTNILELAQKEAEYIASEILKMKQEKNLSFKDFAVLIQKNGQADLIEKVLLKNNIPSVKKVNTNFFKDKTIKNIIETLHFLQNMRNELALVRILKIKLSDRSLYKLNCEMYKFLSSKMNADELKNSNFAEKLMEIYCSGNLQNLDIEEETKNYIDSVYKTMFELQSKQNSQPLDSIFHILKKNIAPYNNLAGTQKGIADKKIKIFEKIIIDYIKSQVYANIKKFNEYIETIKDDKNFELPEIETGELDAVQILTIHSSKGLEFPYVFVCYIKAPKLNPEGSISFEMGNLSKKDFGIIINTFNGKDSPKHLIYKEIYQKPREFQEKLRLFYVALSRAETYLNIINFEEFPGNKPAYYVNNLTNYISLKDNKGE